MKLLTRKEVADYLRISQRTADKIIHDKNFQGVVKIGSRIFVPEDYLESWIRNKMEFNN